MTDPADRCDRTHRAVDRPGVLAGLLKASLLQAECSGPLRHLLGVYQRAIDDSDQRGIECRAEEQAARRLAEYWEGRADEYREGLARLGEG